MHFEINHTSYATNWFFEAVGHVQWESAQHALVEAGITEEDALVRPHCNRNDETFKIISDIEFEYAWELTRSCRHLGIDFGFGNKVTSLVSEFGLGVFDKICVLLEHQFMLKSSSLITSATMLHATELFVRDALSLDVHRFVSLLSPSTAPNDDGDDDDDSSINSGVLMSESSRESDAEHDAILAQWGEDIHMECFSSCGCGWCEIGDDPDDEAARWNKAPDGRLHFVSLAAETVDRLELPIVDALEASILRLWPIATQLMYRDRHNKVTAYPTRTFTNRALDIFTASAHRFVLFQLAPLKCLLELRERDPRANASVFTRIPAAPLLLQRIIHTNIFRFFFEVDKFMSLHFRQLSTNTGNTSVK